MKWNPDAYKKLAEIAAARDKEPIGEMAVEDGLITIEQLEECLRDQRAAPEKMRPRLGEVLVRKGYLRPGAVARLLERQADEAGLRDPGWRYEIKELIGRGATGAVYRAWDRELRREVAVKIVRQEYMSNLDVIRRMLHEARISARLAHANIVPVFDVGTREGMVYFVMPVFDGRTLADKLLDGRFDLRERVELMTLVAEAVHYAHTQGVIHRDLKPRNILLDNQNKPYVMDFGLARLAGEEMVRTRTGTIMGTPAYMSPEQAGGNNKKMDARSDVYALGAMLYEILVDAPPFTGSNPLEVYHSIIHQEPDPPRKRKPNVPKDLELIALKALQKEAHVRYDTAEQMALDMRRWLKGEPVQAREPSVGYRIMKWVRRYPVQVTLLSASLIINILVVVLTLSMIDSFLPNMTGNTVEEAAASDLRRISLFWSQAVTAKNNHHSGRTDRRTVDREFKRILDGIDAILKEHPATVTALYIRGRILLFQNRFDEAEQAARAALRQKADFGPGWMLLSAVLAEKHELKTRPSKMARELMLALRRAMVVDFPRWKLSPTPEDRVLIAITRARQVAWLDKEPFLAFQALEKAGTKYRSEEYLNVLGRWATTSGEGIRLQGEAVQMAPNFARAWFDRGVLHLKAGNRKKAEDDFRKAVELAPTLKPYVEKAGS